jgi:anhydro-N-acetylmuramic acid kinase
MSGTSLDGIDVALVETDGEDIVRRGPSATFPYTEEQKARLRRALQEALTIGKRDERPGTLAETERLLTGWHGAVVRKFCSQQGVDLPSLDIVGFHGQTVLHRPDQRLTVQLGLGTTLAGELGVEVAYDLRAADVAAGGQGAPLVPAYHRALAASLPDRPVAIVNIGGVSNVTWIGRGGELLAFDMGPGNALIDDWMMARLGQPRDEGGALASRGKILEPVVAQFLGDAFFEQPGPKSLDRNSFAGITLDGLRAEDGAATLTAVTCRSIAAARRWFAEEPTLWVITGGGRHNRAIMAGLETLLPAVVPAEAAGFDGDAMEAEAWAYLAVRCLRGLPLTFPGTTNAPTPMTGGVIARPQPSD